MVVERPDMILFWQDDNVFSNWCRNTPFVLHDIDPDVTFENSEAAFMFLKALTFGDNVIAQTVVDMQLPRYVKKQGRRVNSFDDEKWQAVREDCMYIVCKAKFEQNDFCRKILLDTGDKLIVEASPVDPVWGIGLAPNDPLAWKQKNWKGQNLLGKVLMRIRRDLRNK